ncbi:MAG: hypothetical protein ACK5II_00730 [Paracoccus sp. (in: a-proteobacteria)]
MLLKQRFGPQAQHQNGWLSAISFAVPNHNYFEDTDMLTNGLYATWQWSSAHKDTVIRKLIMVADQQGVKVMRGYSPREYVEPGTSVQNREYRGICLYIKHKGYVLLTFYATPGKMVSTTFIAPTQLAEHFSELFIGFTAISRDELPGMPRLSRIILQKIKPSKHHLIKEAHTKAFFDLDEVPPAFADLLSAPVA